MDFMLVITIFFMIFCIFCGCAWTVLIGIKAYWYRGEGWSWCESFNKARSEYQ